MSTPPRPTFGRALALGFASRGRWRHWSALIWRSLEESDFHRMDGWRLINTSGGGG